jgi:hypothetical protein
MDKYMNMLDTQTQQITEVENVTQIMCNAFQENDGYQLDSVPEDENDISKESQNPKSKPPKPQNDSYNAFDDCSNVIPRDTLQI